MGFRNHRLRSRSSRAVTAPPSLSSSGQPLSTGMRLFLPILAIIAYLTLFFAWPLSSISQVLNRPFRRYELFQLLLTPEELLKVWLGNHGEFSIFDRLPIFCVAVLILGAGLAWGVTIVRLFRLRFSAVEIVGIALPVGLNVSSTLVFVAGVGGLLDQRWLLLALVIMPILLALGLGFRATGFDFKRHSLVQNINFFRSAVWSHIVHMMPNGRLSIALAGVTSVLIVLMILGAALPPVDFDVREYHLQCPKEFFQQGRIMFLPHNVYGNMPLGVEMHALLAMVVLDDVFYGAVAGKVVIAMFGVIGGATITCLTRSETASIRWLAPALFLSVPWVIAVSTAGLNDVALAVYVFGAFCAASRAAWPDGLIASRTNQPLTGKRMQGPKAGWDVPSQENTTGSGGETRTGKLAWVAIAGYLAGGAAGCKYTGVLFAVLPIGVFFVVKASRKETLRSVLSIMAAYLIGVVLGGGGWYVKNLVLTGNPIYPLAYEWFGGVTWNAEKAARWMRVHSAHNFSARAFVADAGRILLTSEWQSGLIAPFAVLGALGIRKGEKLRMATLAFVGMYFLFWWFLTHRIDRFWLPMLPFLCVLAINGIEWSRDRPWRWFVAAVAVVIFTWNLLAVASGAAADNRYFAPLAQLRNDAARVGSDHVLLNRLFAELRAKGKEKRLLSVGDAAVFDLEMPVLYATCFDDQPWELLTKGKSSEEVRNTLRAENVGYVYVNWLEIARYRSPGNYGFTPYVQPEQFRALVRDGVLLPVLMPSGNPNQIYLVPE